jgi:hypothetical protein
LEYLDPDFVDHFGIGLALEIGLAIGLVIRLAVQLGPEIAPETGLELEIYQQCPPLD